MNVSEPAHICVLTAFIHQTADIIGCHRRSSYPNDQKFRCDGTVGPPCTVERGDTVLLDVAWNNPGIANMTQSTVWVTGSWGVELPWIGMETEGCQFLDEGRGCRPDSQVSLCLGWWEWRKETFVRYKLYFQAKVSKFEFPILIQEIYPTGRLFGEFILSIHIKSIYTYIW